MSQLQRGQCPLTEASGRILNKMRFSAQFCPELAMILSRRKRISEGNLELWYFAPYKALSTLVQLERVVGSPRDSPLWSLLLISTPWCSPLPQWTKPLSQSLSDHLHKGIKLPWCEQSLGRDLCDEKLRPPANSHMSEPGSKSSSMEPSDDCSPSNILITLS